MLRLGVVSFLNSKPLIEGLERRADLALRFDVPARLAALLEAGEVDVALLPVIDVLRARTPLCVVSDACIASDGETMTVRVFSQLPPHRVRRLCVDGDSHTSVALASIVWREQFGQELELNTIDARSVPLETLEAVLLIGDKVVDPRRAGFAYETDLGAAWRQHTGLPFVFAVWAVHARRRYDIDVQSAAEALAGARDRGVARAAEIAHEVGPELGWTPELAERYLCRCLRFRLESRYVAGAERFARCCAEAGLTPADARVDWPGGLVAVVPGDGVEVVG
ncbi:MAG: Chorismate dehydratase [Phycisphaerae bacterium]|nr:Chorismate dehydratase [Phycisphaerae bacterium]